MPNRIIRESCRTSPTLDALSDGAERMFWRLTTVADDYGRFEAHPSILGSACFPLRHGRLRLSQVTKWWLELVENNLCQPYRVGDKLYGQFTTWSTHQSVRAKKSKHPAPPADLAQTLDVNDSGDVSTRSQIPADVPDDPNPNPNPDPNPITTTSLSGAAGPAVVDKSVDGWGKPEGLLALYNELTPEDHPKVKRLSPGRAHKARAYLKIFPEKSFWVRVFSEIRFSTFLCRGSPGSPNFRADFDWLLTKGRDGSENAVKVSEGKYRDR